MNRSVFRLTAAAALVLGLVAVPAVSGAAHVASKPTGEPVQLMVIGIFSGGGIDFSDVPQAAKAAAAALNKKDGINGSPVKIVECDTGIDPTRFASCVDSTEAYERAEREAKAAYKRKLLGTPTYMVGGKHITPEQAERYLEQGRAD